MQISQLLGEFIMASASTNPTPASLMNSIKHHFHQVQLLAKHLHLQTPN
jgi:hypothetical protein